MGLQKYIISNHRPHSHLPLLINAAARTDVLPLKLPTWVKSQ